MSSLYISSNLGFSSKSEWQQVSSGLQDSSKYSSWFQLYCGLDRKDSPSDLQFPHSLFQAFQICSKGFHFSWYHLHMPSLFFYTSQARSRCLLGFLLSFIFTHSNCKIKYRTFSFFFFILWSSRLADPFVPENFMRLLFWYRFWFVHVALANPIK